MSNSVNPIRIAAELGPQFAARAAEHDAAEVFVAENYDALKARRVFSALVPETLGGGGWRHSQMCGFLRELAGYCGSTALAVSMHQHLVAAQAWNHAHGKPGKAVLEKVAANELVLVSTGARDWMESNGSVEAATGGYRVSARKSFASGCPAGNVLVTSAPFKDPKEGWQVLHFPVPLSAEGVSIDEDWHTLGMRGTGSHTVVLEGVHVPEEAVVLKRPRGQFHPVWNVVITVALPLIASVYVGIAEAAARLAVHQMRGKGAGDTVLQSLVGQLENHRTTAVLALESMVELANGLDFAPEVERSNAILVRKSIAVAAARRTVETAMQVCGGMGYYRALGLERMLRDVYAGDYHPLPEPRQHLFSGRVALGLDPITGAASAQSNAAA